jgi:hypothetical protein
MPEDIFTLEEQIAAAAGMMQQLRNQLLQATLVDRIMTRKKLSSKMTTGDMNADGQNRANISQLKHSMEHLSDIHKELLAEAEKEK